MMTSREFPIAVGAGAAMCARIRDVVAASCNSIVKARRVSDRQWMAAFVAVACVACLPAHQVLAQSAAADKAALAGLASVSGTVSSTVPFKAAKVYFRNAEKRMQYMVYTAGGKYQAQYLLPGNYEMRVSAAGLESAVTQVVLSAGVNAPQNATLRPVQNTGTLIVSMDEMLPPGPGQKFTRDVCVGCHSPNFSVRGIFLPRRGVGSST
jgi:hypothetical protein